MSKKTWFLIALTIVVLALLAYFFISFGANFERVMARAFMWIVIVGVTYTLGWCMGRFGSRKNNSGEK